MPQVQKRAPSTKSKPKKSVAKVVQNGKSAKNGVAKALGKAIRKEGAKVKAALAQLAGGKTARATKAAKRIYFFGGGKAEGNKEMKNLLGGKGANLAEMTNIGVPVPPGFTITTEVCTEFYKAGRRLPKGLEEEMRASIARMEKVVGANFGDHKNT